MSRTNYLSCFLILFFCQFTFAQCNLNDWNALHQLYENTNGANWTIKTNWDVVSGIAPAQNCDLSTLSGVVLNTNNRVSGVELSNNNLVGNIPPEIGILDELDEMLLSGNSLSGNIPPEIGKLQNLVVLELENNNLSGSLPIEIGNLTNLEVLVLNDNNLSGTLPPEYGNLTTISDLFLDNNQLSGCFDENLSALCEQLYYYDNITNGNNFDAVWTDFCDTSEGQCADCVEDLNLSANTVNNQTYEAGQTITSTASINALISYRAGLYILLDTGFCVVAAYDFDIDIQDCN